MRKPNSSRIPVARSALLSLIPAALAIGLLSLVPRVSDGESLSASFDWVPSLGIEASFRIDGLSLLFSLLITLIGALVLLYSSRYLADHPARSRFHILLHLFMASMLGLVLADNLLTLFVFWELTGITSYLLIGFDHEKDAARSAAQQALVVTGSGALAMLAGFILLAEVGGTGSISEINASGDLIRDDGLYLPILILVLAGAFTKSAQLPFHFWLPNAMQAPTPASAYLHSATMVKAGVYLLARLNPALGGTDEWMWILVAVGGATMVIAAFLALQQSDLKRILAYSTVSALGTMVLLIGADSEDAAKALVVFLFAHALYKGALFMVVGAVDHGAGTRDAPSLSGLRRAMPATAFAALLAGLSMAGIPPLFGFLGKETLFKATLDLDEGTVLATAIAVTATMLIVPAAVMAAVRPFVGRPTDIARGAHEVKPEMWLAPCTLAALGFAIVLVPGLEDSLVGPAASAIAGRKVEVSLALWQGFAPEVALSAIVMAGGLVVFVARQRVADAGRAAGRMLGIGSDEGYSMAIDGAFWLARAQTRLLQNGNLRTYLAIVLATAVAATAYVTLSRDVLNSPDGLNDVRLIDALAVALIGIGMAVAVTTRSRLAALAGLGVVGYGIALIYVLYSAPDLAITQVLVETLVVIILVLAFYKLPRFSLLSSVGSCLRDGFIAVSFGAVMTGLVIVATTTQISPPISDFYVDNAVPVGRGENVVNVILVDFRALDTLGEIVVLAVAALGVASLIGLSIKRVQGS